MKDWIQGISKGNAPDTLSAADKKSIGALGPAMENVLDTERPVPIFEFRALGHGGGIVYGKFADFADEVEQEVIRLHERYAGASKVRKRKPKGTMVSPIHRCAISVPLAHKVAPPSRALLSGSPRIPSISATQTRSKAAKPCATRLSEISEPYALMARRAVTTLTLQEWMAYGS